MFQGVYQVLFSACWWFEAAGWVASTESGTDSGTDSPLSCAARYSRRVSESFLLAEDLMRLVNLRFCFPVKTITHENNVGIMEEGCVQL